MRLLILLSLLIGIPADATGREAHWALKPRSKPTVPQFEGADQKWVRNPIDAFVLEKLRHDGLKPAAEADPRTLIRRVTFDLTGLPPTPAEIEKFLQQYSAEPQAACEALVDRLLASSHYGERWGRHWLDVVRFAETEGFEYDRHRPGAWRYRDYVIKSFNNDKPFDRFLTEQLAGDEIDPANQDLLVAAGFHRLGPVRRNAGNQKVAFSRNEVLTEMTDAVGAAFLGLTVGCARCHDHKFDAVKQSDYYRLQAFHAAAQEHDVVLADAKTQAEWKARTDAIEKEIKGLQKELTDRRELEAQVAALRDRLPPPLPTISTVRNVEAERTTIHVLKRGDPDAPAEKVGPRALSALLPEDAPELPADAKSPRTALAKWLNDPDNPLTARVLANRVWQYHFGKGIVATPNDFGVNGARPSHPKLLDWLANEFIRNGRRIKPLHRLILLSSTYRQATANDSSDLLAGFPRRRLSAEEVRDAMLSAAGVLSPKAGGPSVIVPAEADLVKLLYDPKQWAVTPDEAEHNRRSVYLLAKRNLVLPFDQAFDRPDAQTSCPRRESSTHALQALELLNGKLSNRLAGAFAERLVRECGDDKARQIERGYRLIAGRPPTKEEAAVALKFLWTQPLKEFALALFNVNAFIYVN